MTAVWTARRLRLGADEAATTATTTATETAATAPTSATTSNATTGATTRATRTGAAGATAGIGIGAVRVPDRPFARAAAAPTGAAASDSRRVITSLVADRLEAQLRHAHAQCWSYEDGTAIERFYTIACPEHTHRELYTSV